MLAAPDATDAVYAFVNRAIREDRLGEAANALERYIRFQPDDVDARKDLITLYDALGASNFADAQRGVLAEAGVPFDAPRDLTVTGFVAMGAGYDTNPAASPRNDVIGFLSPVSGQIEDVDLNLDREESPIVFLQTAVRAAAPTGTANTTANFDFSAYGAHFSEDSDQDDAIIALRGGPEISFASGTIRPFFDIGYRHFGGNPYAVAGAIGLETAAQLGDTTLSFELSAGYRDYFLTDDTPGRNNLDGVEAQANITLSTTLRDDLFLDLSAQAAAINAATDFEDYYAFGADAALTAGVDAFGRAFFLTVGGGAIYSNYQTPDFEILPFPRKDLSVVAYGGVSTELNDQTTIDAALAYRRRFSNYDIYDNEGLRVTIRVARQF